MIKRIIYVSTEVVTAGKDGNPKWLEHNGEIEFGKEVIGEETVLTCIDHTFEQLGLDTTEVPKTIIGLEDDGEFLKLKYRMEIDPMSLLEFLISEEGKKSGLGLIEKKRK